MKRCHRLKEYSEFIGEIRCRLQSGLKLEDAVEQGIEACRKESVHLSWIIWKNKFRKQGSFPSWSGDFPLRRNRRRSTLRNMQRMLKREKTP